MCVLWVWVLHLSRSYLECSALQVAALHHLSWSLPPSKWCESSPPFHKLPSLFSLFFPCIYTFLFFMFFNSSFTIRSSLYSLLYFVHLFLQSLSSTPYICVFLFALEVNLHTYITTWLSSCLVEIFFGFLTIIVNPKIINKVSP